MAALLRFAGLLTLGMGIFGATLLPSEAGDYSAGGGNVVRHGMHAGNFGNHGHADGRSRMPSGHHFQIEGRGPDHGFGHSWQQAYRDHLFANHPRRLQRLASGNFYTPSGSGITIQLNDRPALNDAGASDSYATAAGTYSIGYSDYVGDRTAAPVPAPKAKIIDVATMHDACAYENGVCVIRP